MQELIKVSEVKIGFNTVNSVSARELHDKLEVKKDFSSWIKAQIKRGFFEENIDFVVFTQKGENLKGGRPTIDYILTIDTAKEIAMMSGTAKGKEVRNYFIELEKRYFQKVETQESDPIVAKVQQRTKLLKYAGEQFEVFENVFKKIGIEDKTELAITSNRAVKNETTVDFIALSGRNGLEAEEKFFTVTELCELIRKSDDYSEEIKLSVSTKDNLKPQPRNLNKILESNGFQVKVDKQWKPTKKGESFSKFVQNKSKTSTKNIFHLNWKTEILREIF